MYLTQLPPWISRPVRWWGRRRGWGKPTPVAARPRGPFPMVADSGTAVDYLRGNGTGGLTAGHRPDDEERLLAGRDRGRQRVVRRLVGEILLAGEKPHQRSTPPRRRVADSPAQRRIGGFDGIEDRALGDRPL